MVQSHFERLVENAMRDCEKAAISIPLGDNLKLAHLQGRHAGLRESTEIYRKATRVDTDDEDGI